MLDDLVYTGISPVVGKLKRLPIMVASKKTVYRLKHDGNGNIKNNQ